MTSQLFDETLMKCWQTASLAQDRHGLRECSALLCRELTMVLNQAELNYTHCIIKHFLVLLMASRPTESMLCAVCNCKMLLVCGQTFDEPH